MKVSKHYKPDGIYEDRTGTQYTVTHKPQIRGYHMTRLQSDGQTIANATTAFHRWIKGLKYIGSRQEVCGDVPR